jgi:hypothetical protein
LDIEVASVMEMAETASSTNAPITSHKQERLKDSSSLLPSQTVKQAPNEEPNATRVESRFTDTKKKMKEI